MEHIGTTHIKKRSELRSHSENSEPLNYQTPKTPRKETRFSLVNLKQR